MKRVRVAVILLMASSLGACASLDIELRSARIVYEPVDDWYEPPNKERPQVILRVDFTTTSDFNEYGTTIGYLVPCGAPRGHLGSPVSGIEYGLTYITPPYDTPKSPGQVFTAQFVKGSYGRFFSVTSGQVPPADGNWRVHFEDALKSSGLCFYVKSGFTVGNMPTSPDIRIDGLLEDPAAPQSATALEK